MKKIKNVWCPVWIWAVWLSRFVACLVQTHMCACVGVGGECCSASSLSLAFFFCLFYIFLRSYHICFNPALVITSHLHSYHIFFRSPHFAMYICVCVFVLRVLCEWVTWVFSLTVRRSKNRHFNFIFIFAFIVTNISNIIFILFSFSVKFKFIYFYCLHVQ